MPTPFDFPNLSLSNLRVLQGESYDKIIPYRSLPTFHPLQYVFRFIRKMSHYINKIIICQLCLQTRSLTGNTKKNKHEISKGIDPNKKDTEKYILWKMIDKAIFIKKDEKKQ